MKKKTKIVIAIAFIIAIIAIFTVGCHASKNNTANINTATTITAEAAEEGLNFELVAGTGVKGTSFYRETTTDTMYVFMTGSRLEAGGLTQMFDPQTGLPLTYENWVNNYKNK